MNCVESAFEPEPTQTTVSSTEGNLLRFNDLPVCKVAAVHHVPFLKDGNFNWLYGSEGHDPSLRQILC